MTQDAKAAFAESTSGRGSRLDSTRPGAFAARASSPGADGSGAPSRRLAGFTIALFAATLALLALAPLSEAKLLVSGFGIPTLNPQAYGGQMAPSFNQTSIPLGVAVNTSGNGAPAGTAYVVDNPGKRVERFGPSGNWQSLWGQDVIAPSVNDTQRLLINASGGTFRLSFNGSTTDPIPYDGSSPTAFGNTQIAVDKALAALPSIGDAANVSLSGNFNDIGLFFITFTGALAAADQPQISVDTAQLTGTAEVTTLADGTSTTSDTGSGFEICTVATECKAGSVSGATANGGQLNNPQGVAVNQANGHVYVTESGNRRVSEFDADGNFIRAFGWDVVKTGGAGDVSTNAFEVCTVAADCKQGASGANGGQFGSAIGYPVTDSSNNVWVPDAANRRIQEFDSSGNFIAAYGWDVDALGGGGALEKCTSTAAGACQVGTTGTLPGQFADSSPGQIAFDSAGNLYAIDFIGNQSAHQRVLKFDPTLTTATVFGASAFAPYTTKGPELITSTQGGTRLDFALTNDVSGGGEGQIVELDPGDASVKDTSFAGSGIRTDIGGLSGGLSGNLYATVAENFVGGKRSSGPRQVLVLGDTAPPAPTPVLSPINTKTDTTATFAATVNPNGGLVSCKFQYSTDQTNWTDVPAPGCDSLAPTGVQALSQKTFGLTPNTHYYVRLAVSRPLLANSTVTSGVKAFDTDSVPPVVRILGAAQIADTSARLVGRIDPRNSATGYVFEYGTTPALGLSTAPVNIGAGNTPIVVSQLVTGLDKDTTYYSRLVATNAFGSTPSTQKTFHTRTVPFPPANPDSCPNQALRAAQGAGVLGDCRAWEQVSPVDKNGGNAIGQVGGNPFVAPAADGNAVGYCTGAPLFGDPVGQMTLQCASYVSRREAGGWQLTTPFPRYCRTETLTGSYSTNQWAFLDANMRHAVVWHPENANCFPPLDPNAPLVNDRFAINLYREDLGADPASSTYDLLAPRLDPGRSPSGDGAITGQFIAADPSFDHIFINSDVNQTDPPDSPAPREFGKVYEWTREGVSGCATAGGCLSLFSVDPAGQPFQSGAGIPGENNLTLGTDATAPHPVSDDGERAFLVHVDNTTSYGPQGCPDGPIFAEGAQPCELYMRAHNGEPGAHTYDVSASERSAPDPNGDTPAFLQQGTTTGTVGFFASCEKLTDDSTAFTLPPNNAWDHECSVSEGEDLYRWSETPDGSGHHLTDISVDHEPADGASAHYMYTLGASDSGDVAYFATTGQILSGADTTAVQFAKSGNKGPDDVTANAKLYRWSWNDGNPTTEFLGLYDPLKRGPSSDLNRSARAVTPDGNSLTITTDRALDPAADTDTDADVYRWDQGTGWTCLSCQLPGTPSAGDSGLPIAPKLGSSASDLFATGQDAYGTPTVTSDDGSRVFFNSADALLPADTNGNAGCPNVNTTAGTVPACLDVYEWHDGTLSLISSGTGANPSALIGTTGSGKDVFFWTGNRLVGWDKDNGVDIYDARSDGGFPEPATTTPCDLNAGACRGAGSGTPSIPGAGTPNFQGPDNPPIHRKHHKPKKRKKHHKHHHRAANRNRRAGR